MQCIYLNYLRNENLPIPLLIVSSQPDILLLLQSKTSHFLQYSEDQVEALLLRPLLAPLMLLEDQVDSLPLGSLMAPLLLPEGQVEAHLLRPLLAPLLLPGAKLRHYF